MKNGIYTETDTIYSGDIERRDITPNDVIGTRCFYGFSPSDALSAAVNHLGYRRGIITAASGKGFIVFLENNHGSSVADYIVPIRNGNAEPLRRRLLRRNIAS